jgi:hypothetical protein
MIPDETKASKYILIDTTARASYAKLSSATLSKHEAETKNKAFKMNRVTKKYILAKNWK